MKSTFEAIGIQANGYVSAINTQGVQAFPLS
jgi:hypothetical protein